MKLSSMARIVLSFVLAAAPLASVAQPAEARVPADIAVIAPSVGVSVFDDDLAPYGSWSDLDGVGRVWVPSASVVGLSFVPYASSGHWVNTDAGWVFESSLPFGWATYHYGRWVHDRYVGWVWAPGTEWAPSWVEWRTGGGYVGWAPMGPVGFVAEPTYVFIDERHFGSSHLERHLLARERADAAMRATNRDHATRDATHHGGPEVARIEQAQGHRMATKHLERPEPGVLARPASLAEAHRSDNAAHADARPEPRQGMVDERGDSVAQASHTRRHATGHGAFVGQRAPAKPVARRHR